MQEKGLNLMLLGEHLVELLSATWIPGTQPPETIQNNLYSKSQKAFFSCRDLTQFLMSIMDFRLLCSTEFMLIS